MVVRTEVLGEPDGRSRRGNGLACGVVVEECRLASPLHASSFFFVLEMASVGTGGGEDCFVGSTGRVVVGGGGGEERATSCSSSSVVLGPSFLLPGFSSAFPPASPTPPRTRPIASHSFVCPNVERLAVCQEEEEVEVVGVAVVTRDVPTVGMGDEGGGGPKGVEDFRRVGPTSQVVGVGGVRGMGSALWNGSTPSRNLRDEEEEEEVEGGEWCWCGLDGAPRSVSCTIPHPEGGGSSSCSERDANEGDGGHAAGRVVTFGVGGRAECEGRGGMVVEWRSGGASGRRVGGSS